MKSNIEKVHVSCSLCGSAEYKVIAHGREHEYTNTTDDLFTVVRCRHCGLFYLNPRPAGTELATIYPNEYAAYIDEEVSNGSFLSRLREAFVDKLGYPTRIRTAIKYLPYNGDTIKVLDVGCGNGRALSLFKKYYPGKVETVGIDFDENAIRLAQKKGHAVMHGMFEEVDLHEESFDCVYSSHVIEHVADPKAFLKKIKSVLKPGGMFFCETPNIGSVEALFLSYAEIWGGFHFPRHWTFFSPKTLRQLGESVGLRLVTIRFYMIPIFWIWTLHSLSMKLFGRKLADLLFPPIEHKANRFQLFLMTGAFTILDFVTFIFTRRTACMFAIFRNSE